MQKENKLGYLKAIHERRLLDVVKTIVSSCDKFVNSLQHLWNNCFA